MQGVNGGLCKSSLLHLRSHCEVNRGSSVLCGSCEHRAHARVAKNGLLVSQLCRGPEKRRTWSSWNGHVRLGPAAGSLNDACNHCIVPLHNQPERLRFALHNARCWQQALSSSELSSRPAMSLGRRRSLCSAKLTEPVAPDSDDAEGSEGSGSDPDTEKADSEGSKESRPRSDYAPSFGDSLPPEGLIILLSCLVGVLTGGGVVLFNKTVHLIHDFSWAGVPAPGAIWLRNQPLADTWLQILGIPIAGGFLVGGLNRLRSALADVGSIQTSQNADEGDKPDPWYTTPAAVAAPVLKAVAAAVTLGTGNSLGPEGPSVEIGAGVANSMGTLLKNSRERRLALVAAGSAAGIASGFNAAVAGTFFAVESVLRTSSKFDTSPSLTTAMVLLASVLASVISNVGLGTEPAFIVPPYELESIFELPLYLLLGLLCGVLSVALTRGSTLAGQGFEKLQTSFNIDAALLPPIGALCVGLIALAYPEVLYFGFENVDALLQSRPGLNSPDTLLLLQLVGAKIVATALSRGAGLVGGVYAPSLFIGAALGSAYGKLAAVAASAYDPAGFALGEFAVSVPQAYSLVGMAAMLAGVCQVPLTSVLLLFELTQDYRIILPLMGAVGLSSWVSSLASSTEKRKKQKSPTPTAPLANMGAGGGVALGVPVPGFGGGAVGVQSGAVFAAVGAPPTGVVMGNVLDEEGELCSLEASLCVAGPEFLTEDQLLEELTVGTAMTRSFVAVPPGTPIREAVRAMLAGRQWCALVVGPEGVLEGILTLADVQEEARRAKGAATGDLAAERIAGDNRTVASVCTGHVPEGEAGLVTVFPDTSLEKAQRLMTPRGLRQLPVVAREEVPLAGGADGEAVGRGQKGRRRKVVGLLSRDAIFMTCRAEATRRAWGLLYPQEMQAASAASVVANATSNGASISKQSVQN